MAETVHETIFFERHITAAITTVWNAYLDPVQRAQWSVPAGEAMVFDEADFREGGGDRYRCGPPASLDFSVNVQYHKIIPEQLIVYTETVTTADQPLATSIVTWALSPSGRETRVKITAQLVSYVGQGMVDGHHHGHAKALEQLQAFLTPPQG